MNEDLWLAIIGRITPSEPTNLDGLLEQAEPEHATSEWAKSQDIPQAPLSAMLWERDPTKSFIGVRVLQSPIDLVGLAHRLAAIALERNVIPILISHLPTTGFERFGFRVERLPVADAEIQQTFETELRRFWNMAIVIDLAEVENLG